MEKAHYIYKTYLRELKKLLGINNVEKFKFFTACADNVATFFDYRTAEVKKILMVYRGYIQLKKSGFEVSPDKFTLIELAVSYSPRYARLRKDYFQFSDHDFQFSDSGLERFNNLCLEGNSPIKNPQSFKKFRQMYVDGFKDGIWAIENREKSVDKASDEYQQKKTDKQFLFQLEDIFMKLEKLHLSEFNHTGKELKKIGQIVNLVNAKLSYLIYDQDDERKPQKMNIPNNRIHLAERNIEKRHLLLKKA